MNIIFEISKTLWIDSCFKWYVLFSFARWSLETP